LPSTAVVPVFDFHMHPGPRWVPTERRLHEMDINDHFGLLISAMDRASISHAVCFLLDEDWFRTDACEQLMAICQANGWSDRLVFCALFDIFRPYETEDILAQVHRAASLGVKGIKIHPAIQRITTADLPLITPLVQEAQRLNLFIMVHAYHDAATPIGNMGIEIADFVANQVTVPVVIAHAGGLDLPKAVAVALKYPHVSLDISSYLELEPQYDVVSLMQFAVNTLGAPRLLFGTDHYSCDALHYKNRFLDIFQQINLTNEQINQIMWGNAIALLSGLGIDKPGFTLQVER
jgi:predicted TIM-barrel fold metal-dependent hydrolase